jgi:hypothetical protein
MVMAGPGSRHGVIDDCDDDESSDAIFFSILSAQCCSFPPVFRQLVFFVVLFTTIDGNKEIKLTAINIL